LMYQIIRMKNTTNHANASSATHTLCCSMAPGSSHTLLTTYSPAAVYQANFRSIALPAYTTTAAGGKLFLSPTRPYLSRVAVLGRQKKTSAITRRRSAPAADPIMIAMVGIEDSSSTGGGGGGCGGVDTPGASGGAGGPRGGIRGGGLLGGAAGPEELDPVTGVDATVTPNAVVAASVLGSCVSMRDTNTAAELAVPSTVTMVASTIVLPTDSANSICAIEICNRSARRCFRVFWSTDSIDRPSTSCSVTKWLRSALANARRHFPHRSGQWMPLSKLQMASLNPGS
jgi:hypothetical protein